MAVITEPEATIGQANALSPAGAEAAGNVAQYSKTSEMIKARLPQLVKGAGYVGNGNAPLTDEMQIMTKASQAAIDLREETHRGVHDRASVVKGMNQDFLNQFGYLKTALQQPSLLETLGGVFGQMPGGAEAFKNFTAGNLGYGVYGLVPFDLIRPARLIYPVYTVWRNKFPRPQGQGTSAQERVITGISGSQTGGQGVMDVSIQELVQSGGSFSNWPLNLPPSGSQSQTFLNVPYRFFGISEQLSWLAQFAGQGYEDIAGLANLIMLQEAMLGEEYQMIAGTSTNLSPPSIVSVTARTAGSNETTVGSNANYSVYVTATNYFGETTISANAVVSGGTSSGQVVDVVIGPSAGAMTYNIYVSTNGSPSRTNAWLQVGNTTQGSPAVTTNGSQQAGSVGGIKFTLQGSPPSSGANPPSADTGTGKNTRMEGVIPTLSGHSNTNGVYPAGWQGGYINQNVGTHLSYNAIYTALDSLWESGSNSPGAFKADPAEIVGDGGDIMRLSNDVISAGAATNYRLFLEQQEVGGMRVGGAVSEFQNPVTRSILKLVVHPWFTQGTAAFMTYQPPMTYSQVSNAWEMRCVVDYSSIKSQSMWN